MLVWGPDENLRGHGSHAQLIAEHHSSHWLGSLGIEIGVGKNENGVVGYVLQSCRDTKMDTTSNCSEPGWRGHQGTCFQLFQQCVGPVES